MQIVWYCDNPDIVKWAVLLQEASLDGIKRIVHVAMWTDDEHAEYPHLNRPPGATARDSDFAPFVADHFHKLDGLRSLAIDFGLEIEVWPDRFTDETREDYFRKVCDDIKRSTSPTLWFFDPDNGIQPEGGGKRMDQVKYITLTELSCLHMAASEASGINRIAVYQHNNRRPNWPHTARQRLQDALKGHPVDLHESEPTRQAVVLAIR